MVSKLPRPQSILFVCHHNAIRSPMAEGMMKTHFGEELRVESCGLSPGDLDEYMVMVMKEKKIDMSDHRPKPLTQMDRESFEMVIAFTESASEASKAHFGENAIVETWPVADPTIGSLDVRALMNNYRAVRDNIESKLRRKFISKS